MIADILAPALNGPTPRTITHVGPATDYAMALAGWHPAIRTGTLLYNSCARTLSPAMEDWLNMKRITITLYSVPTSINETLSGFNYDCQQDGVELIVKSATQARNLPEIAVAILGGVGADLVRRIIDSIINRLRKAGYTNQEKDHIAFLVTHINANNATFILPDEKDKCIGHFKAYELNSAEDDVSANWDNQVEEMEHLLESSSNEAIAKALLQSLSSMGANGNFAAVRSLTRLMLKRSGDEKGAATAGRSRNLMELLDNPNVPICGRLYAHGVSRTSLFSSIDRLSPVGDKELSRLEDGNIDTVDIVKQGTAIDAEVLKSLLLLALLKFNSLPITKISEKALDAVVERIMTETEYVPGVNATEGFKFGRDVWRRCAKAYEFFWVIYHELGHDIPKRPLHVDSKLLVVELLEAVFQLRRISTSAEFVNKPLDPTMDQRRCRTMRHLIVIYTVDSYRKNYKHQISFSHPDGFELESAVGIASVLLNAIGVPTGRAVIAFSSSKVTHVGFVLYADEHTAFMKRDVTMPSTAEASDLSEQGRAFLDELRVHNGFFSTEKELVMRLIEFIK